MQIPSESWHSVIIRACVAARRNRAHTAAKASRCTLRVMHAKLHVAQASQPCVEFKALHSD